MADYLRQLLVLFTSLSAIKGQVAVLFKLFFSDDLSKDGLE